MASVAVELNLRELWLVIGPLEVSIKEMAEADPYRMGMTDPDRESELQERRDLVEKLHAALIELGRQAPPE
jgi:hypothetical protein